MYLLHISALHTPILLKMFLYLFKHDEWLVWRATCVLRDNVETRHRNWKHSPRITSSPCYPCYPNTSHYNTLSPQTPTGVHLHYFQETLKNMLPSKNLMKGWALLSSSPFPARHHNPLKLLSPPLRSFVDDVKAARLLCMIAPWGVPSHPRLTTNAAALFFIDFFWTTINIEVKKVGAIQSVIVCRLWWLEFKNVEWA